MKRKASRGSDQVMMLLRSRTTAQTPPPQALCMTPSMITLKLLRKLTNVLPVNRLNFLTSLVLIRSRLTMHLALGSASQAFQMSNRSFLASKPVTTTTTRSRRPFPFTTNSLAKATRSGSKYSTTQGFTFKRRSPLLQPR